MKLKKKILISISIAFITIVSLLSIKAFNLRPQIWLTSIIDEQTFDQPVHLSLVPDKNHHYLVSEKSGKVFLLDRKNKTRKLILDISSKVKSDSTEEGLLASLIDPQYPNTIYIYYCMDNPMKNRLSRFQLKETWEIDESSEEVIIEFTKPHTGHNGGDMRFGQDSFLWISLGEASYAAKKQGHLLDESLIGSILRIDVHRKENGQNYAIPADNPYNEYQGKEKIRKEIWAHGLRNPWRWSFNPNNTNEVELIVADVGDVTFEELNRVKKGDHFGWPYTEGPKCSRYFKNCQPLKYKNATTYFSRDVSRSIIGGFIYRGNQVSTLKNKYVFGDFLRGIMTLPANNFPEKVLNRNDPEFKIVFPKIPASFGKNKGQTMHPASFFEDENKEILVIMLNGGIFELTEISIWTQIKSFLFLFGSSR